jgi:uncharacterized RDD family membrane protein YckC
LLVGLAFLAGAQSRGVGILIGLATPIAYGTILEGGWDGQTVGKRLLNIRVVKESGRACDYPSAFIRNVPALVQLGLLSYLVAFASMAATDKRQRLFDRAAQTVVVETRGRTATAEQTSAWES